MSKGQTIFLSSDTGFSTALALINDAKGFSHIVWLTGEIKGGSRECLEETAYLKKKW